MNLPSLLLIIQSLTLLLTLASPILHARVTPEQAEATFKQLYANRLAAVARTAQFTDNLELAKELLTAAIQSKKSPQFALVLARNAAALASKNPTGYATAARAWQIVAEADPANMLKHKAAVADLTRKAYAHARGPERTQLAPKVITAYKDLAKLYLDAKQYDQAVVAYQVAYRQALALKSDTVPSIKRNLDTAVTAKRIHRLIRVEKTKLKRDPKDAKAAKQLIHLYLVELDDPKSTLPYTIIASDAPTRQNINLTKTPLNTLTETQVIQLADWRLQLASTATTDRSKAAMLIHAYRYYTHFHDKGSSNAFLNSKVKLARARVQRQLADLNINIRPTNSRPILNTSKTVVLKLDGKQYTFNNHNAAIDRSVSPPILRFYKPNAHLLLPREVTPSFVNKTFSISASVKPTSNNGVICARGGMRHGISLYLNNLTPAVAIRYDHKLYAIDTRQKLPKDKFSKLKLVLTKAPAIELYLNNKLLGKKSLPSLFKNEPYQGLQIAADTRKPIGQYKAPNHFSGRIKSLKLTFHK